MTRSCVTRKSLTRAACGTLLALALAGGGLAVPALTSPAAAAFSAEVYQVPKSRKFVLAGLGYGHGIGMSQFGAEGMGRLGKTYQQIVKFYYPGTTFASAPEGRAIKVSLSGVVRQDFNRAVVLVEPRSGLHVMSGGTKLALPSRVNGGPATGYRVLRAKSGLQVRAYRGTKSVRVASALTGTVRFATAPHQKNSRITLTAASGSKRSYRGFLDVRRAGSGLLAMSNVLLEHYLRSVVSSEVPSSWTKAALRAQAVAARSYALLAQRNATAVHRVYDICDTSSCQAYGTLRTETPPEVAAVKATAGRYLKQGGEPAFTMYSSANGGYSVAGSRPYLVAQPDPYDGVVGGAANWGHSWDKTVTAGTIENAWPQIGHLKTLKVTGRDGNGQWGGRVTSVVLVGSQGKVSVSADSFRWGVGLKSAWWTITNVSSNAKAAPRKVRSNALDRGVRVRWAPPNTDKQVRGYRVTVSPGDRTVLVARDERGARITGLTNGRQYRARVRAIYGGGPGAVGVTPAFVPKSPLSYYEPLTPKRVLDEATAAAIASGGLHDVDVLGHGRAPLHGTRTVVLRVSTATATRTGRVLAWPKGARDRRVVATTYTDGSGSTGLVTVPVTASDLVTVGSTTKTQGLSVDLVGYYTSSGVRTKSLHAVAARRVVSSATGLRWPGRKLAAGSPASVPVAGKNGVPDGARTVLVNLGLSGPSHRTTLSIAPQGTPASLGAAVRAPAGQARSGTTVARLDQDGRLRLRLTQGRSHVTLDVLGWFQGQDGTRGGRFRATKAETVFSSGSDGLVTVDHSRKVRVRGGDSVVPGSASTVAVQVLARGSGGPGSLSLLPAGSAAKVRPVVAFGKGAAQRNLVVVPVGADGSIRVSSSQVAADVSLRVVGWYS